MIRRYSKNIITYGIYILYALSNLTMIGYGLGTARSHRQVLLFLYVNGYNGLVTMPSILNILPPQPPPEHRNIQLPVKNKSGYIFSNTGHYYVSLIEGKGSETISRYKYIQYRIYDLFESSP